MTESIKAVRLPALAAVLLGSLLGACAPNPGPTTRPEPETANTNRSAPAASSKSDAPAGPTEAPPAWQRLDAARDGINGTGVDRALAELLADRRPTRRVVVAVIDGGIDTLHAQLAPVIWRNEREVAGNGIDDDRNGYVDDVRGWSMIPKLPGDTGRFDTMELTRLHAACSGAPAGARIPRPADADCARYAKAYGEKSTEISGMSAQITSIGGMYAQVTARMRRAVGSDSLTVPRVQRYTTTSSDEASAKAMWLRLADAGIDSAVLATASEQLVGQQWGLNTAYDPRALPHDARGSNDVNGPDPMHGTHVAGIIGAVAASGANVRGIAPYVTIMPIRAVPDGDERDEEVARAIRYAVDNGAQVVNMSFGKGYSPGKPAVDSAVRYAAQKGVLLVHAAGNDGADNDTVPSFPSRRLDNGDETPLWLEIGASSWKGGAALPAEFSNYGARSVDLFAPGVDIVSTVPGGKVAPESGTSMAAPVVSGVAALLLSYFPSLTPAQVRGIIVETARPLRDLEVKRPGDETDRTVRFGMLSRTGGVIDAYAAVQRAIELAKPLP